MDAHEAMRAAELGEAMYMREMWARADVTSRRALGLAAEDVGGGCVLVMAEDPTGGFWNRTIGMGITEPLSHDVVARIHAVVRRHGGQGTVFQVAPGADPDWWEDLLASTGAQPGIWWTKFAGDLSEGLALPDVGTDLAIRPLEARHGEEFAHVMCTGFSMPTDSPLPAWFAQLPSWGDGFSTYGAFDDDGTMVASAVLLVRGELASLCGAATLPSHRGRGAQSGLMVRRIRDAEAAGARWVVTETGSETEANPHNASLRNMRRVGLTELYQRRNHVWFAG